MKVWINKQNKRIGRPDSDYTSNIPDDDLAAEKAKQGIRLVNAPDCQEKYWLPCCENAERTGMSYLGLPIIGNVSGYDILDPRPEFKSPAFQAKNSKAQKDMAGAKPTTPIIPVASIAGWVKSPAKTASGFVFPTGAKMFSFRPGSHPAVPVMGAVGAYYENGRWVFALLGATRENHFCHLYDIGGNKWVSVGSLVDNWHIPWSKALPTIVFLIGKGMVFCSQAVLVSRGGDTPPVVPPEPPEPPPAEKVYEVIIRSKSPIEVIQV